MSQPGAIFIKYVIKHILLTLKLAGMPRLPYLCSVIFS